LKVLRYFADSDFADIDLPTQRAIDAFVLNFLHLFCQADYQPRRDHALQFIECSTTISNLVSVSVFRTTDPYLEILRYQETGLGKLLALYSARNSVLFDREQFFARDPELAGAWYVAFAGLFKGALVRSDVCKNFQVHYAFQPPVFQASDRIPDVCYGVSYVDSDSEQSIKPIVNRWIRSVMRGTQIRNTPNPKKIAVLSCLWWPGQSSYRTLYSYVEALRDFDLTLFYVPMPGRPINAEHFREAKELRFARGALDIGPLLDNDFQVAFFPDVGMTSFSIWLANLRIAPIQLAGTGHPVSTWGAHIDYFISGADVETRDRPERYYSERLVLLPGQGAIHPTPEYTLQGRTKSVPEFVVNCPWSLQKVNHAFCELLAQIVQLSRKTLRLRLFVGNATRDLHLIPFVRELSAMLAGAIVEIVPNLSYSDYMALMEEGELTLDSNHWGGSNSMADSLHLRKLMVSCEGERWYNRIGPQMLRLAGLDELIVASPEAYVATVLRLIHDEDYRHGLERRLANADLAGKVFSQEDAKYFRTAIEYLIAHHESLRRDKERTPIRIERDSG
jgi:hypothetical protein